MSATEDLRTEHALRAASRLMRIAAHPLRLRVLVVLELGDCDDRQLRAQLGTTGAESLRSHVNVLCGAGILKRRSVGRGKHYSLTESGQRLVKACVLLADGQRLDPAPAPGRDVPPMLPLPSLPR